MRDTVRRVEYFYAIVSDKPGEAARVLTTLSRAGVNLTGFSGFPHGSRRSQLDFIPEGMHVERLDAGGLMSLLEGERGHACGGGAIVSVLRAAHTLGASRTEILRYADSGDAGERDKSRVVGYLAAALFSGAGA